jgi:hypothetical protein
MLARLRRVDVWSMFHVSMFHGRIAPHAALGRNTI